MHEMRISSRIETIPSEKQSVQEMRKCGRCSLGQKKQGEKENHE